MMDFPTEHLATLVAVVDSGSFDAAARALRITPSAVSQRIKALEQQSGRVLVERSKPARVTESGGVVLRLARQVALLAAETDRQLSGSGSPSPSIPLVVNADSLATWILPALATLPDLRFDLYREDQDHSTALLRNGTVMGAVTSDRNPVQGCTVTALGSMRYRAMASPDFVGTWMQGGATVDALAGAPMLVFDRDDDLQDRYLRRRFRRSLSPPRSHVPGSREFVLAVTLGLGWAMLPELQADELLDEGRLVQLDAEHPVDIPLYWQQWSLDSPALASVAGALHSTAARLLR